MSFLDELKNRIVSGAKAGAKAYMATDEAKQKVASSGYSGNLSTVKNTVKSAAQPAVSLYEKYKSRREDSNWYAGETPTRRETLARIYDLGNRDESKREALMQAYQQEVENPLSPIYNPYGNATTQKQTKTTLSNTQKAMNEWAALADELSYWAGRTDLNLSDDDILARVDWDNYKTLQKMDEGRLSGSPLELLAPVGYSEDAMRGVLWAARNPESSTGDAMMDAVQSAMGRGKAYVRDDIRAAQLDPSSQSYNPYAVSGTMLDLERKYGTAGFDADWLEQNMGMRGNTDYAKVYNAEQFTAEAEAELEEFNRILEEELTARPTQDVDKLVSYLFDEGNFKALAKLDESLKSGKLLDTTRAIHYDRQAIEQGVREYVADAQLREAAMTDPDAMDALVSKEKQEATQRNGGTLLTPGRVEEGVPETVQKSVLFDGNISPETFQEGLGWVFNKLRNLREKKLEETSEKKETDAKKPDESTAVIANAGVSDVSSTRIPTAEEAAAQQEQVYALEAEGRYKEAAEMQFPLIVAAVTNSEDEYVKELVTSVGSQEAAMYLTNLVLQGDMLDEVDDLDVWGAVTDYEYYICQVLDIDTASADMFAQAMDYMTGGAYSETKDNKGVGVIRALQSTATQSGAKVNDLWANIAGFAMTGYGHLVKGTNQLINATLGKLFDFEVQDTLADKTVEAGQQVAGYYNQISAREDAFMRQNASPLEYFAATAGSEAIKMGVQSVAGAAVAGKAAGSVSQIMSRGGARQLQTALDLAKAEGLASKLAAASPFIADSAASEFHEAYQETENPVTALISGVVSGFATASLMNLDAIRNIERMGKYVPEVISAIQSTPGSGLMATAKRYGKAGMMYIGNMLKTAANEAIQEPTENFLKTWVTDTLKGKGFFSERDWGEYASELASDAFYAAIGTFGNSLAAVPSWSRSAIYANQMMGKTGLTPAEVTGQLNAFMADMDDPQVASQLEANLHETAVEARTGELLAQGGLPETDNSAVDAAQKKADEAQARASETAAELESATARVGSANEQFRANPADDSAKNKLSAALKEEQSAQKANDQAIKTAQAAQAELEEAQASVQAQSDAVMGAARAQAEAEVEAAVSVARDERAAANEVQRESDNAAVIDADNFISTQLKGYNLTDEDRQRVTEMIRSRTPLKGADNREGSGSRVKFITGMQKKFGMKITVRDTTEGGQYLRYNGMYDPKTDSIVIDSKATQSDVIYGVLLHELTHKAERSEVYGEFAKSILALKYGEDTQKLEADIRAKQLSYDARLKKMAERDASVDATPLTRDQAQREIVADLTREILYGDETSIQKLCAEQPSVAQRILEAIRNFIDRLRGVNDPAVDQLNKTRDLFEKALGQSAEMKPGETRSFPTDGIQYSLREEPDPVNTIKGYKVFVVFDNKPGELYPPMVANPGGDSTPVGVWLNADAAPRGADSKTGRAQVQAGGKGTQASKMSLAYRPGWHLGDLPMATQFLRKNPETGKKELFPANFVWAECECAADHDYQEEAMSYGYTKNGKFQHSLAGLPRLPREEDGTAGYYRYRTNPNPDTVPWIITGAMKVTRILDDAETDAILRDAGVEPIPRQGGPIDLEKYGLAAGNVENHDRVQYQIADDEPLLSKAEYARLRSNWNSQKTGTQFQNRPGGGKLIAMDNLLVYTNKKGEPEHVVEINQDDLWLQNDIQQDLVLMEQEGFDLETQRIVLEGSYGTGSAYFRDRGAVSESARENRAGAGRNARAVRKGNYVEVSYEGEEVSDGRAKYSLPSDDILSEMVDSYLSQRTETEQPKLPQGERQFVRQTMPNTEAVPEWIWREFQQNPDELNYDIDSNREQVERGWQRIQENGYDTELNRLMETDTFGKDDTAQANLMMAMALREDDPATFMALASKYNKEGTKAGQTLQARKLFTRMSPTGARIWMAGKLEGELGDFIHRHRPIKTKVDQKSGQIADSIRELDSTDLVKRLTAGDEVTLDNQNNRFCVPINAQQQALIERYGLGDVKRPGLFYNRATTKQRMLEAILATPNPLEMTGNGLNLIQRLEYMKEGAAVVTNADLNYIGSMLSEFVARGGEDGGREADVAVARAYEAFGNITPATVGEKAKTWRYMAMLTSVPSAIRNVIGNATQNTVNAASHGIAVELDKIVSKYTGARTTEHLSASERVAGWKGFVEETKNTFRDYFVDKVVTQRGEAKYSTSQKGRVYQSTAVEAIRNVEGFLMSFGDRNVWRKAYLNSMAEQQKLADQNLLFNEDGTTRTHEQMLDQAEADANYATFTEDNQVSNILGQLKRVPGIGHVVELVMPFTGVPANITRRMIQYSPIGLTTTLLKNAYGAATGKTFDQQAFVQGVSRGLTGTALFGVGMLLAQMGAIKMGTGEEEDKKKYGLQTAMGQQYSPFIYNPLTDEYVSLSVFSPAASALTMGGAAWMDFQNDEDAIQALQNAAFGSIDQIFDASYMSGLSDLFGGYGSFGENLRDTLLSSAISQNVPAILSQLANTVDPYVRNTKDKNSLMQALKSGLINKIPFLRQQLLPEKVDVTGQTFRTKEGLRNFYDPFTTTDARQEPVVDELFRLSEALGSSSMLPSDALSGTKNSIKLNKQTVVLDGEGKEAYQKRYGELWLEGGVTIDTKGKRKTVEGVRELMASVRYQRMSDEEKADAIADILSAAMTGAKMEAIQKYGSDAEKE